MAKGIRARAKALEISPRSFFGLNATNFFLAEIVAVVMPFLGKYLLGRGWHEGAIGSVIGLASLGVFLMQAPAGFLTDRIRFKRLMLAVACGVVGVCYVLLPVYADSRTALSILLFIGGMAQAFFLPMLGAFALRLAGRQGLPEVIGANQFWNHAGNILSALAAMALVRIWGLTAIFYGVGIGSALAVASIYQIRPRDLKEELQPRKRGVRERVKGKKADFMDLIRQPSVCGLIVASALFHFANAPILAIVGLNITRLGGNNDQVAATVLVAQVVMVIVAWVAGRALGRFGRKTVFLVGFAASPLRILLYALVQHPWGLVALQALDGIGAGIYGVLIVVMCADLTRGKGHFNALQGVIATALSLGGVVGPFVAGYLAEHLGFVATYKIFSLAAAVACAVFWFFVPETGKAPNRLVREEEPLPHPT